MSSTEPRYRVGMHPYLRIDRTPGQEDVLFMPDVWEVYRQHDGPAGTEHVARFKTRREARDYARRMNQENNIG